MSNSKTKYKKLPSFVSPACPWRFPKIAEPDYGNEKYPKENGEFSVGMVFELDSPEAQQLIADLTPHYEEALAQAEEKFKELSVKERKKLKGVTPNPLYETLYDRETEEETGEIVFKAKMAHTGVNKKTKKPWTRWPMVFDAKGERIKKVPDIWGGTVGKVAFEVSPYFVDGTAMAGLSLRLTGVQILDLVEAGERSAESLGFQKEEGYTAQEQKGIDFEKLGKDADEEDDDGEHPGDF